MCIHTTQTWRTQKKKENGKKQVEKTWTKTKRSTWHETKEVDTKDQVRPRHASQNNSKLEPLLCFWEGRNDEIQRRLTCVSNYYVLEKVSVRHDRGRIRVSDLRGGKNSGWWKEMGDSSLIQAGSISRYLCLLFRLLACSLARSLRSEKDSNVHIMSKMSHWYVYVNLSLWDSSSGAWLATSKVFTSIKIMYILASPSPL